MPSVSFETSLLSKRGALILRSLDAGGSPDIVSGMGIRLQVEEAELICAAFNTRAWKRGEREIKINPYDFPSTIGVWKSKNGIGASNIHKALKEFFKSLMKLHGVDPKTPEGFKKVLPHLDRKTIKETVVNHWGTSLRGLLASYGNSRTRLILDFIDQDPEFAEINRVGLKPYDFKHSAAGTWTKPDGSITKEALGAAKELLTALAKKQRQSIESPQGFKRILGEITAEAFGSEPINYWGTTLGGLFGCAAKCSPSRLIITLVNQDPELAAIKRIGLEASDFTLVRNLWVDKDKQPTKTARKIIREALETIAKEENLPHDIKTVKEFRDLLKYVTKERLKTTKLNFWGTTSRCLLREAYNNSPAEALLDLVNKDPDFIKIKAADFSGMDLPFAPNGFWIDREGKATPNTRNAVKKLVFKTAGKLDCDPRSQKGFLEVEAHLDFDTFCTTPINAWGTTLQYPLIMAYSEYDSRVEGALEDLVFSDDDFIEVRKLWD